MLLCVMRFVLSRIVITSKLVVTFYPKHIYLNFLRDV